ncbi:MAG: DUF983 domain-containing protein [Hyphomicrobiaceae bacterium]
MLQISSDSAGAPLAAPERHTLSAMLRGFARRCPSCGEGHMFDGYLKVRDSCPSCGEELHHHRADDAPPYFTIFIVGHIAISLVLALETAFEPPMWLNLAVSMPAAILASLVLLPLIKGALVGLQWALRMHGFGGETEKLDLDATYVGDTTPAGGQTRP